MVQIVHRTWARTYASRPARYEQPATVAEVQALVRAAAAAKTTLTIVGAAHSPSTLTMTSGWLLNLDKLNRVLRERPGPAAAAGGAPAYVDVSVEAGMRIHELSDALAARGLALQSLGSISDQSVAGIISTGTHGSSAYHGLVSAQYVDLTLVRADGSVVTCSDTAEPALFRAALLGLGKFGVIVGATVRAVPAFNLKARQELVSFDELLSDKWWPKVFTTAEFHRVWWYPYTGQCVVWRADRTDEPARAPPRSFYGTTGGRLLYQALLWLAVRVAPSLTPAVEGWLFRRQFSPEPVETVQRSDRALNIDVLYSQFVNEWALPLARGREVLRDLEKSIAARDFYVHAPFEIRVANHTVPDADTFAALTEAPGAADHPQAIPGNATRPFLESAPAAPYAAPDKLTEANLTLHLNATMYRPFYFDSDTAAWYTEFERACAAVGGRPHWAKNFLGTNAASTASRHHMRGIRDQVAGWYGADLAAWKKLRREADPDGVFLANRDWMDINGLLD